MRYFMPALLALALALPACQWLTAPVGGSSPVPQAAVVDPGTTTGPTVSAAGTEEPVAPGGDPRWLFLLKTAALFYAPLQVVTSALSSRGGQALVGFIGSANPARGGIQPRAMLDALLAFMGAGHSAHVATASAARAAAAAPAPPSDAS